METGQRFKVSYDGLENRNGKSATPGLQGEWFIHYIIVAPMFSIYDMTTKIG